MKVLLINVNAVSGSTGKIVTDIKTSLEREGHRCLIAYGNGVSVKSESYFRYCHRLEQLTNNTISRITGKRFGSFLLFSFNRLRTYIEQQTPDVVHVHCPNGFTVDLYKLLEYLAISNIKTVLTNHAEFWYTANCEHAYDCDKWKTGCGSCPQYKFGHRFFHDGTAQSWHLMKRAFERFGADNLLVASVSPWVCSRSKQSPYLGRFENITVENGVDTRVFFPHHSINKLKEYKKPVIFHASAYFKPKIDSVKGSRYIVEIAKQMPEAIFVIAALTYDIKDLTFPANIILLPPCNNQEKLAELYSSADCTVITSKRETFSMIVAESLCCGTPVVGFCAGGPESIAIEEYSKFVPFGNLELLKKAIREFIYTTPEREKIVSEAHARYCKERMTTKYLESYKKLLSK